MEDDDLLDGIIEEIEHACIVLEKKENIPEINKADKILISILNGNSNFCLRVSFKLLQSAKEKVVKEFGAQLLYHTIKTTIKLKNFEDFVWDWIINLIDFIIEADSEILRQKLCKCLCILAFGLDFTDALNPSKMLLEIIVKTSIKKNADPDVLCLSFLTSLADEFNETSISDNCASYSSRVIDQYVRDVQAHSIKILNYGKKQEKLKILALKCFDSWLQRILTPNLLQFALIVKVFDSLHDTYLTFYAHSVIQSLINLYIHKNKEFNASLSEIFTKHLIYTFPYLTLANLTQLTEVICETTIQKNIITSFVAFCSLHILDDIDDKITHLGTFDDTLKIMYRVTAIGSCFSPLNGQPLELITSPFQFWNDFFDSPSIKWIVSLSKFNYLFSELFYIFVQKVTLFPWLSDDPFFKEAVMSIRKEVSCIFKKMASIDPNTFLDNFYVTYKLYEQQCFKDPQQLYLLEVVSFILGSVILVIPITDGSLPLLKDIYGSIPSLLNSNPAFIGPFFSLLGKSAKVIATVLNPVFVAMTTFVTNYIVSAYNSPLEYQRLLIISCTEFIASVLDQIDFQLDPSLLANLIRLFGELFGFTFKKIRSGQSSASFLSDKHRKSYISMARIVVRALSCMSFNYPNPDIEVYVSLIIREVIDFFDQSLIDMSINPIPTKYKDVLLLLQLLHEISIGLLVDSKSGKGGLKLIFERLCSNDLLIRSYNCIWTSEVSIRFLNDILKKCIYKGFGENVEKVSLDNFISYNFSLIHEDHWQLVPALCTYIDIIHQELDVLTVSIDFVAVPLITIGLKNLLKPKWPNAPGFFTMLVFVFKKLPPKLVLYNYISLETARTVVLQLLEYSKLETWPEASKTSIKCLKHFIRCSYSLNDGNLLFMSKVPELDNVCLGEHVLLFIFDQMLISGSSSVVRYHPIIHEIFSQNSNDFMTLFHKTLHSSAIPPSIADSDAKNSFYWKFIDSTKNKEDSLDLLIRFFSSASLKQKM